MRLLLYAFLFAFATSTCAQQTVSLIEVGTLPKSVDECSGMVVASKETIWVHNDSGGKAELIEIDQYGELKRKVELNGAENIDWEDACSDDEGNVYIGDIGNNEKKRYKLKVYKFSIADVQNDAVTPQVIEFLLPDNALQSKCHYDIEAMAWTKGRLYFFTKDRCDKKDNSLFVYSIPDDAGHYTAKLEGEFRWDEPEENIKVTAADIAPDGKKLVLLSKDAIHFFYGYKRNEFFNGSYNYLPIPKSQKEALVHLDDCHVMLSEEGKEGKLWKLNLCKVEFGD